MNYSEQLMKRCQLMSEAYKVMSVYMEIADKLFSKETGKYSMPTKIDVKEDGIYYEYYIDHYDYSRGRDDFFVSKEKLESLKDKHLRNKKLKNIERITK